MCEKKREEQLKSLTDESGQSSLKTFPGSSVSTAVSASSQGYLGEDDSQTQWSPNNFLERDSLASQSQSIGIGSTSKAKDKVQMVRTFSLTIYNIGVNFFLQSLIIVSHAFVFYFKFKEKSRIN